MKENVFGILLFIATVFTSNGAYAQSENESPQHATTPIPFEVVFGTDGWTSQLIIDKKFAPESKFGFFGLSYLKADYENEDFLNESVNLALLKYDLIKRVSIFSGALYNSQFGFRPYAGAQYTYHSRNFMGVLNSGFHLTETQNFESLAIVEYRPAINNTWSVYSRLQGIYSHNTDIGKHDRSYVFTRLGLSYKTYSFGFAYNYDCYGPTKIKEHQFGIFLSALLR